MIDEDEDKRKKQVDELVADEMRKEIENAWSSMLQTPSGRLIAWSILDRCNLGDTTFNGNVHDTLNKGRQQIGSEILDEYVYPMGISVYCEMLKEAEIREKRLEQAVKHTEKLLLEENDDE